MKRSLISMDFSEVSVNALRYILSMHHTGDQIDILHVDGTVLSMTESPVLVNLEEQQHQVAARLEAYIREHLPIDTPDHYNITVKTGEIVNTICHHVAHHKYDTVVLGTRDKWNLIDKIIGNVALGVVKKSSIPVLLIPHQSSYNPIAKALVAIDEKMKVAENLDKIKNWNLDTRSVLHMLHIADEDQTEKAFNKTKSEIIASFFEQEEVPFSYQIDRIISTDIATSVLSYADEIDAELIITLPSYQDFITSLFVSSVSKELILKTKRPILFIK